MFERQVNDAFEEMRNTDSEEMKSLVNMIEECIGMKGETKGDVARMMRKMFNKGKEMDYLVQVMKIAIQHLGL